MIGRGILSKLRGRLHAVRRFGGDTSGAVLAEFALAFPLLVTLIIGGVEIGRFVLLEQKMESVAVETADLVAQIDAVSVTTADLNDIFSAVDHIAAPFTLDTNGKVIVTEIGKTNGGPVTINWQRAGGGTGSGTSRIGAPGSAPTLPTGFVIRDGEALIVSETFYNFTPLFGGNWTPLAATQLYNIAYYRPRFGTLATLN